MNVNNTAEPVGRNQSVKALNIFDKASIQNFIASVIATKKFI